MKLNRFNNRNRNRQPIIVNGSLVNRKINKLYESGVFDFDEEDLDRDILDVEINGVDLNDLSDEDDDEEVYTPVKRYPKEKSNIIFDVDYEDEDDDDDEEDDEDDETDVNIKLTIGFDDEDDDELLFDDEEYEIDENTTAAIGGYNTPNAFVGNPDDDPDAEHYDPADFKYGTRVKKTNINFKKTGNTPVNELRNNRGIFNFNYDLSNLSNNHVLNEGKSDDSSPKDVVNNNIKEINEMLRVVERKIKNNLKLKVENELSQRDYWKPTMSKIKKMNESLMRISRMLNELGA